MLYAFCCSSKSLTLLLAVFVYDPLFLAADLTPTAVGLFVTLAQQSGTRWLMNEARNSDSVALLLALNVS